MDMNGVNQLAEVPFKQVERSMKATVFDVDYNYLNLGPDGDLYVTSFGWPILKCLTPDQWYHNQRFAQVGKRQTDGVGTVYHVPIRNHKNEGTDLIVKFSRFAQCTMLYANSNMPHNVSNSTVMNAHINSPFEEFSVLLNLRRHGRILGRTSLLTKRPLAIYIPPELYSIDKLGRSQWRFDRCQDAIRKDQNQMKTLVPVHLDIQKDYILLYHWVKGENAQEMHNQGLLSREEVAALTVLADKDIREQGFRVLDNKPQHIILRKRSNGELLRRKGELVYALVDFELLEFKPTLLKT
jgi:hypothetical protein